MTDIFNKNSPEFGIYINAVVICIIFKFSQSLRYGKYHLSSAHVFKDLTSTFTLQTIWKFAITLKKTMESICFWQFFFLNFIFQLILVGKVLYGNLMQLNTPKYKWFLTFYCFKLTNLKQNKIISNEIFILDTQLHCLHINSHHVQWLLFHCYLTARFMQS